MTRGGHTRDKNNASLTSLALLRLKIYFLLLFIVSPNLLFFKHGLFGIAKNKAFYSLISICSI